MTFTQLEYIVAIDTYRHFASAAAHCFITQPTLSMQVQKLEKELGVKLFDRTRQPVVPTENGKEVIEQARTIIAERNILLERIEDKKGTLTGELRIGIIPTLAPYLLPLFIHPFTKKYPGVKLVVTEMRTEKVIARLREGRIDTGILVTPLEEPGITEHVLFYEELLVYVSKKNAVYKKMYVLPNDIDPHKLWMLEEGHCFRSQVVNLCELQKLSRAGSHFEYEAGSIETLRRMVEMNDGITIIPELSTTDMSLRQQQLVRHFKKPVPMREVSLVVHRNFVKKRLTDKLQQEILAAIPEKMKKNKPLNLIFT